MEAIGFGSSQPTNCALWFSGSGTPTISLQAFDGAGVENLAVSGTITATNGFIIPQRQLTIVGTNCTFDLSTNYSATPFLVLTTNVYMTQPTNLMAGQNFMVQVYQDTVGGRSLGFDTNYWRFPSAQMLTTTTNANSQSLLSCTVGRYATNVFVVQTLNFQ